MRILLKRDDSAIVPVAPFSDTHLLPFVHHPEDNFNQSEGSAPVHSILMYGLAESSFPFFALFLACNPDWWSPKRTGEGCVRIFSSRPCTLSRIR